MNKTDTLCRALIDSRRYPLAAEEPGGAKGGAKATDSAEGSTKPTDSAEARQLKTVVRRFRRALDENGCAVARGFLSEAGLRALLTEAKARRKLAHFSQKTEANAYFSADDPSLPPQHPRRIFMPRGNGFITGDCYGARTKTRALCHWRHLARFVAECLRLRSLHIYADPVAAMIVNVGAPGTSFNWHFDTNEYTITLLLRAAEKGGVFQYAPGLRRPGDENYAAVGEILRGGKKGVKTLRLRPGDLQLFRGRYSLHRVTKNEGTTERLMLIMSFAEKPGMMGSVHRTRELYGRATPAHLQAAKKSIRPDTLTD